MNYARHIGAPARGRAPAIKATHQVVFFTHAPPESVRPSEYAHWAFYMLPFLEEPRSFVGHLVGEDSEKYCDRLKHTPRTCLPCKIERRASAV